MRIIFHHPLPLNEEAAVASEIRPVRMVSAFKELGLEVDVVAGFGRERKDCIKKVLDEMRRGVGYAFMYSESSNLPTLMTDPHHLPLRPFMDFSLFKACKYHGVPLGVFYRDIYWLFDVYKEGKSYFRRKVGELFYRYDLLQYASLVDRLYVPSMEMARYIPYINRDKFRALPPGHESQVTEGEDCLRKKKGIIRAIYVGGMSSHYRMQELFAAVEKIPNVIVTICTREKEWQNVRDGYPSPLPENIRIVHASGSQLKKLYSEADIALLFVQPTDYWKFAAPVKLYEYLGHGKPIIASSGTLAADFVVDQKVGWSIPYDRTDLCATLSMLLQNPALVVEAGGRAKIAARAHSWHARAKYVLNDLSGYRGNGTSKRVYV